MSDLLEWLRLQLDDDERVARDAEHAPPMQLVLARTVGKSATHAHVVRWGPARVLAEVEAKRRIIAEHEPEWQTVEWPHDQNGKGEAQVCRRCQNAEHTEWWPALGEAGVLPEGFVAPYVIAPCPTVRLLVLPYADRPGYRDEWRP